jgi:hypothetical protein
MIRLEKDDSLRLSQYMYFPIWAIKWKVLINSRDWYEFVLQMQFMLLFSRQGKLRLQKWYVAHQDKMKKKITRELVTLVLSRKPKMCSFLEWKDLKVVYKRYKSFLFSPYDFHTLHLKWTSQPFTLDRSINHFLGNNFKICTDCTNWKTNSADHGQKAQTCRLIVVCSGCLQQD